MIVNYITEYKLKKERQKIRAEQKLSAPTKDKPKHHKERDPLKRLEDRLKKELLGK